MVFLTASVFAAVVFAVVVLTAVVTAFDVLFSAAVVFGVFVVLGAAVVVVLEVLDVLSVATVVVEAMVESLFPVTVVTTEPGLRPEAVVAGVTGADEAGAAVEAGFDVDAVSFFVTVKLIYVFLSMLTPLFEVTFLSIFRIYVSPGVRGDLGFTVTILLIEGST